MDGLATAGMEMCASGDFRWRTPLWVQEKTWLAAVTEVECFRIGRIAVVGWVTWEG